MHFSDSFRFLFDIVTHSLLFVSQLRVLAEKFAKSKSACISSMAQKAESQPLMAGYQSSERLRADSSSPSSAFSPVSAESSDLLSPAEKRPPPQPLYDQSYQDYIHPSQPSSYGSISRGEAEVSTFDHYDDDLRGTFSFDSIKLSVSVVFASFLCCCCCGRSKAQTEANMARCGVTDNNRSVHLVFHTARASRCSQQNRTGSANTVRRSGLCCCVTVVI